MGFLLTSAFAVAFVGGTSALKGWYNEQIEAQTQQRSREENIVSETELSNKLTDLDNNIRADMIAGDNEINTRITNEVETLNNTINQKEASLNERIDAEVETLNDTINNNKQDIETKLTNGLNTKIDKDIADSLVSGIAVSQVEENQVMEPTLKITSKNTDTKTEIVQNVHFKAVGDIQTKMENDHIIIDSTNMDKKVQANIDHLTQVDASLKNHETEIASLQQHDLNHESILATHTEQIADHETRILANKDHLTNVDEEIEDIKSTHQSDINEIHTVNADQEAHLTRIDQTNLDQDERIQDNANSIIETNKNVSKNAEDIATLNNNKLDKSFANTIDNKITGKIEFSPSGKVNGVYIKTTMIKPTDYTTEVSEAYIKSDKKDITFTGEETGIEMNVNAENVDFKPETCGLTSVKLGPAIREVKEDLETAKTEINETINTKLTELDNKKVDKSFTNNLVNTLTYTGPQNSELFKLNKQDINPNDNSTSSSTFTIKSSDNTLVATPVMDGEKITGIDLATNLDVDVHYFVTSETLNTTIPSENTIQISSLTDTTSDNVEVKDIVSDSEGTWARVQEVNTEEGTLKCITFAKHAQAVWGTIKGNIEDQQDLQEKLDEKVNIKNVIESVSKIGFGLAGQTFRIINNYQIPLKDSEENQGGFNMAISFPAWMKPKSTNLKYNNSWGDISFDVNTDILPYEKADSGLTSSGLGGAVRELKGLIDDANIEVTKLEQNKVDKAMQELVQGIEPSTFDKTAGELTLNYDAFDVTTNGTTKKSIVISDMFKQEDLDAKLSKTDFTQGILLDGIARSITSNYDLALTTNKLDTTTMTTEEIPYIRLKSVNQTVKITPDNEGTFEQIVLDVATDNIKVNTPNEGTENQKDIITAVEDLYKLPRITSYDELGAGFEMKPGMITYAVDSTNNLAYLVICKTAFTIAQDNLEEDFNTNITNGNLVRIGIPNETL